MFQTRHVGGTTAMITSNDLILYRLVALKLALTTFNRVSSLDIKHCLFNDT